MIKDLSVGEIPIRIYKPNNPVNQVLIGVHGFTGSQDSETYTYLGNHLEDTNIMFITFDLPNHGKNINETPITLQKCLIVNV